MSTIRAGTTTTTALTQTGDTTGNIVLTADSGIIDAATGTTGGLIMPTGTTAQRPGTPTAGTIRWNTTDTTFEVYTGSTVGWVAVANGATYSIEYLLVAGGGGGSLNIAGGGAGGYIAQSGTAIIGTVYSIVIGAGCPNDTNANGSNTTGFSQTALGGGSGAGSTGGNYVARSGGSGGGGTDVVGFFTGAAGTIGQGFGGGNGGVSPANGGGGGGASASGGTGGGAGVGGAGGAGLNWQSLGTFYAGGGGGAGVNGSSLGGSGGGGNGARSPATPTAGAVNTGGGGGGGYATPTGASGGSGIAIVRYPGAQRGTGGIVSSAGGFTYHTFTTSGTYTA
jgi:hypothetical protein